MNRIEELYTKRAAIFQQLVSAVAEQQRADLSNLAVRNEIEEETEELIENWSEADVENVNGLSADSSFQKLLAEHHELGEEILNIRDDDHVAADDALRKLKLK